MQRLAIIGASYLQEPLIQKAKGMGLETHVFAWAAGDVGEKSADFFYPVSIVEKEKILSVCKDIRIDGICSIASDLAMTTVNYIANELNLTGNSLEATAKSTNKHFMRLAFEERGDPSPRSILVDETTDLSALRLEYPVIVKPTDRSGSRGIFKLEDGKDLAAAVSSALAQGFEKKVLIEEYARGQEYSVEYISFKGEHSFLALTQKYTTGSPHFIETGHLQPAPVDQTVLCGIQNVVTHALDTLGIENGASHSELKVDSRGNIRLIEIGARMGGDFIGSNLVEMSTGIDFLRAVIQIALGKAPDLQPLHAPRASAVRFILSERDLDALQRLKKEDPEYLVQENVEDASGGQVTDSSNRLGWFLMRADTAKALKAYLPNETDF